MRAADIYSILAPYSLLCNKHALADTYKSLRISATRVLGCSQFGTLESFVNLPEIQRDISVDADSFLSLLRSLPGQQEFEIRGLDGKMAWRCGPASGAFAFMSDNVEIPNPEWVVEPEMLMTPDSGKLLEIGGMSCGSRALMSVGLFGILFDNANALNVYATDDITVSSCNLGKRLPGDDAQAILSPDAARLLSAILAKGHARIAFDKQSVFCRSQSHKLMLKQVPPLRFDVRAMMSDYIDNKRTVGLDADVVGAFIKRAEALSDEKAGTMVSLEVNAGQVKLIFAGGRSNSEEFCPAKGDPTLVVAPISIEARRMSRALAHSDKIAFDHADKNALVFQGKNDFNFVVSGKVAA